VLNSLFAELVLLEMSLNNFKKKVTCVTFTLISPFIETDFVAAAGWNVYRPRLWM